MFRHVIDYFAWYINRQINSHYPSGTQEADSFLLLILLQDPDSFLVLLLSCRTFLTAIPLQIGVYPLSKTKTPHCGRATVTAYIVNTTFPRDTLLPSVLCSIPSGKVRFLPFAD